MKTLNAVVIDPVGLHARPATVAVSTAAKFKCSITVGKAEGGKTVNMKSIMGVMGLGIPTQTEIVITFDGEDEDVALATVEAKLREQKVIA
ncbi:MAG: HPr family phosphocarrier protein [Erysipelotrichaceae bacterium]|nr:HPr family phosphocarrier protein [Erysipelotrichaceae bacterium]MBQ7888481.1 HPr family phosphocarrier protein [Erysipelotrichaceae bacterium]